MQALLFEMQPREGHEDHYFRHADALRPHLEKQDGLIFIERFKSISRPGVILSHSLWRDEASIAKWRTHPQHNKSQVAGRTKHFQDYRIRILHVLEHFSKDKPLRQWSDQGGYRADASDSNRFLAIVSSNNQPASNEGEHFVGVNSDDRYIGIVELESEAAGRATIRASRSNPTVQTTLFCLVSRDYGLFDRAEAPQYYPEAKVRSQ